MCFLEDMLLLRGSHWETKRIMKYYHSKYFKNSTILLNNYFEMKLLRRQFSFPIKIASNIHKNINDSNQ